MQERISTVHARIHAAAAACGRNPETVRLVAVSKTMPAERVRRAIQAGAVILGENYIQEAREKFNALVSFPVEWHFIGHLQSKKAKYAVRLFDLIHSVDSLKLALELNKQARKIDKIQQILVQVNISREESKSGVFESEIMTLLEDVSRLENLRVRGLMTMPPFFDDPDRARPYFRTLRQIAERIQQEKLPHVAMEELSMGMSGDFEVAIAEGATLVRIGTAIFGARR